MYNKPRFGKFAYLFSILGGLLIAVFYRISMDLPFLFIVGIILFLISIYFSIKSFHHFERGISKFTPLLIFIIYLILLGLYFISFMFIGEN